jgi:hypothetical protein
MSLIFYSDEESLSNINIDDLYEKNLKRNVKHISIFNKLLGRIHKRIHVTAKNKVNDKHVWFTIPNFIFGEANYDQGECVAHIIAKLTGNGFLVKYVHPNTLFVSWEQWIPSYIRSEYKKKTGIIINEKGQVVSDLIPVEPVDGKMPYETKDEKKFTSINNYKPTGHLVYNPDVFEAIVGNVQK